MEIKVNRFFAKPVLFLINIFCINKVHLVCLGYGGDFELFTELNWKEDKDLDLYNDYAYQDYRLWF